MFVQPSKCLESFSNLSARATTSCHKLKRGCINAVMFNAGIQFIVGKGVWRTQNIQALHIPLPAQSAMVTSTSTPGSMLHYTKQSVSCCIFMLESCMSWSTALGNTQCDITCPPPSHVWIKIKMQFVSCRSHQTRICG